MAVALPLMVSTLSYSLMQFCDRVFLTWSSPTSVAAAMPASVMAWTLLAFPLGVAMYTGVFVAQYFGANQSRRVGEVIWHGLILGSLFIPLFLCAIVWPRWIFEWSGHPAVLVDQEASYLSYVSWGSIAQVHAGVLAGFFVGQARTRVVMIVDVSSALLNVLLDWLLIFGFSIGDLITCQPLGIAGAALATSLALGVKLMVYLALVLQKRERQRFGMTRPIRLHTDLVWRMLRFGSSNGWQMLIECLGIAVFSLMIGQLGEELAAASTLAISVNMLVFVPVWGLSTAVSTLVGQQIGKGQPALAARATWSGVVIGLVYTSLFAALYLGAPDVFLIGHDAAGPQIAGISQLVRQLLVFVAIYCLFDAIQIVFVGALKGAGDVRFVVISSLVCSGLFVAAGLIGQNLLPDPLAKLYGWWGALTGWVILLTVVYSARFLQGRWKQCRVIETGLTGPVAADPSSPGPGPGVAGEPAGSGPG